MNPFFKSITLSIVLGAGLSASMSFASEMGQSAEQRIFMQSVVSAVQDAAKRGDMQTAQRLTQEAYKTFATFKKIDDMEKVAVLSQLEQAAKPTSSSSSGKKMLPEVEQKRAMSVQQVPAKNALTHYEQNNLNCLLLLEFGSLLDFSRIADLLSRGANPNATIEKVETYPGRTVDLLDYAKRFGKEGSRISEGDPIYFIFADYWNHENIKGCFDLLVNYGFDINKRNKSYDTILHYIDRSCHPSFLIGTQLAEDFVSDLMRRGVNPDAQNNKGQTAFMLAFGRKNRVWFPYAAAPNIAVIRVLMKHNADPFIVDNEGRSALDYFDVTASPAVGLSEMMPQVLQEFENYKKAYKQKRIYEMSSVISNALPPRSLTGLIAEYLFGEK